MLTSPRRRAVLIGSAVLLSLTLGAGVSLASVTSPAATTQATSGAAHAVATPEGRHSLIGLWNGTVRTTIPTGGNVVYRFSPDGTMAVIVGTAAYPGMWKENADGTFFFEITLPETDSSDNLTGFSYAEQNATLVSPGKFTSSGNTRIFDLQGNVIKSFDVYITATRKAS